MADVGRITELWRAAADALENPRDPLHGWEAAEIENARLLAECSRLRGQLDAAEDALRKILGPDPSWDADAQHDYGFRYDGPFAPAWVRDIANDVLVARAALGVEGEDAKP